MRGRISKRFHRARVAVADCDDAPRAGHGKRKPVVCQRIAHTGGIDGDSVILGDPNGGGFRTTTRREIENVPGHSQGKFLFLPEQFMPGQRTPSLNRLMSLASAGMQMTAPFNDVSTALAGSNINITNGGVTVNVNSSNASPQDIASAVSDAYGAVKQAEYYALSRTLNNAWMG